MLIQTGRGSISLVAGCCWVHSVREPPPGRHRNDNSDSPLAAAVINRHQGDDWLSSAVDQADSQHHAP